MLLAGRSLYGVGIGLAMHAAPAYISETSPPEVRWAMWHGMSWEAVAIRPTLALMAPMQSASAHFPCFCDGRNCHPATLSLPKSSWGASEAKLCAIAALCTTHRGLLVSFKEAAIVGGILAGYAISYTYADAEGGWRAIYDAALPLAGVLGVGMVSLLCCPWLCLRPSWIAALQWDGHGPSVPCMLTSPCLHACTSLVLQLRSLIRSCMRPALCAPPAGSAARVAPLAAAQRQQSRRSHSAGARRGEARC
jgi:MFS family permease